jgi:hypothetical protein
VVSGRPWRLHGPLITSSRLCNGTFATWRCASPLIVGGGKGSTRVVCSIGWDYDSRDLSSDAIGLARPRYLGACAGVGDGLAPAAGSAGGNPGYGVREAESPALPNRSCNAQETLRTIYKLCDSRNRGVARFWASHTTKSRVEMADRNRCCRNRPIFSYSSRCRTARGPKTIKRLGFAQVDDNPYYGTESFSKAACEV